MEFCPNFSLIVWRLNAAGQPIMARLRCKSWQCAFCEKKNREMWRSHLKKRIGRIGGSWWFITLTAHENTRTPGTSLKNLRDNLDRLFKRVRRVWKRIDYVRVYETHQNAAFHCHMVVQGLSPRVLRMEAKNGQEYYRATVEPSGKGNWSVRTWFRRNARQIGLGYMVDVQPVGTTPEVVNYITKYMTKQAQAFHVPHLRRIQTTERIGAANPRGEGGWKAQKAIYGGEIQYQPLKDLNLKITIPAEYWRDNVSYP